ncbi:hypothetical protein SAMN05660420_03276 [Desulfuromusa kysingii]|uniref:Uncharacterized protein n=1 Tax=Desulfuromusa kysingii TaxID=37625 RepID=A0A1H4EB82_9BACT|nr:hypothetical protein [Desulfuromusa kysingii]SEA81562.1 hypothetical protein SAMN05660420_03276 [Desulfuromusa kysingii]
MKKIIVLLLLFVVTTDVFSLVVLRGTIQEVYPDIRSVIINQSRYQLADDAKIYLQNDTSVSLLLDKNLVGKQVIFNIYTSDSGEITLKYLAVLDR